MQDLFDDVLLLSEGEPLHPFFALAEYKYTIIVEFNLTAGLLAPPGGGGHLGCLESAPALQIHGQELRDGFMD